MLLLAWRRCRLEWLFAAGLAATMIGDYFLVYCGYGVRSAGFYGGVAGFSITHLLYISYFKCAGGGFRWKVIPLPLLPALAVLGCCIGKVPAGVLAALVFYAALSSITLAGALNASSRWFAATAGLLFISDVCIALGWLGSKLAAQSVGLLYLASLATSACAMAATALKSHE
jgi:hypothetical protein